MAESDIDAIHIADDSADERTPLLMTVTSSSCAARPSAAPCTQSGVLRSLSVRQPAHHERCPTTSSHGSLRVCASATSGNATTRNTAAAATTTATGDGQTDAGQALDGVNDHDDCDLSTGKGCCWACWETSDTDSDPLIRVCQGCKDRDLQWIHQTCIDRYITSLPTRPPVITFVPLPLHALISFLTTSATAFMVLVQSAYRSQPAQFDIESGAPLVRHDSQPSGRSSMTVPRPRRPAPTRKPVFACTRCSDAYNVVETPIHPLITLYHDTFLAIAMAIMTSCILVLSYCCIVLLQAHWGTDHAVFDFGDGGPRLRVTVFAGWVLAVCHTVHAITWRFVWLTCSGRSTKHVVAIAD
ncbi:hypothetical protein BC831DRAFT_474012 [Entophlyctis helioformis]|nr:hypothetical protein BC831DRAFT_474012 [Entophlyctis helioformis]